MLYRNWRMVFIYKLENKRFLHIDMHYMFEKFHSSESMQVVRRFSTYISLIIFSVFTHDLHHTGKVLPCLWHSS